MATRLSTRPVLAALILGGFLFQQAAAADPAQREIESPDGTRLQWKFAEGQTIYYTHEEERSEKHFAAGQVYEIVDRRLFKYKWAVMFEMRPDRKAIGVSFERVRNEIVTPEQTITSDTYQPLSPRGLSAEAKTQQDEIYRVLQTHFMFLAAPNGGILLPEKLFADQPVPSEFKTPLATGLFSPETFTTGDSLSLPDRNVKTGDEWTTATGISTNDISTRGHYRVLGRANRLGHDCWQIEGTTTYDANENQLTNDIASRKLGPRQSMHFFDDDLGRLVLSEETTPLRIVFRDGRIVETLVRVKRQLAQPPSESGRHEATRELADGETRKFFFRNGVPVNAQDGWLKVLWTGLALQGSQAAEGTVNVTGLTWFIQLDLSGQNIKSLRLFDVTQNTSIPLEYHRDTDNRPESSPAVLFFDPVEISSSQPEWFHNDVTSERIIKVVVENEAGEIKTLYQLIFVQTASLRASKGIALPRPTEDRE